MHPADQKVANWYTQTHSDTHFTYRLSVSRALAGGGRVALLNRRFRQVDENGNESLVEITHAKQLADVLEDVFLLNAAAVAKRSEERRVGKGGRRGWVRWCCEENR